MTRENFIQGMTVLLNAYSKDMTKEQIEAWWPFFADDDYDEFRMAVKKVILTSKFFPSLAEIKEAMAKGVTNQIPAVEAWQMLQDAIGRFGYYQAEAAMASLPLPIQNTVKSLGGFQRICQSEEVDWLMKDFMRIYNDINDRAQEQYITGTLISWTDIAAKKKLLEGES